MNAMALLNQALQCQQRGEQAQAIALCEGIVREWPTQAEAWRVMAHSHRLAGRPAEALPCFERAAEVDPGNPQGHFDLAYHLASQGQPEAARVEFDRVLALDPTHRGALVNQGLVLGQCGEYPEARLCLERALQRDPRDAAAAYNLGLWHLLQGDLASGWIGYQHRFQAKGVTPRTFPRPQWHGERLPPGEALLVAVEQGLGDLLQFVRYMPRLREHADRILLECPKALQGLLARSPGVDGLVPADEHGGAETPFGAFTPLLDVPRLLVTTLEHVPRPVPYLFPDPRRASAWARRLGSRDEGIRVGLVWSGNPAHENDRHRSIPLEDLLPLAEVQGVRFFGLQVGAARAQAGGPGHRFPLMDLEPHLADFEDTAAAIAHLDLVISVDTSVAHLAGGMGTATWLLLPFHPDWRWLLHRADSPWYPTMRLFRQAAAREWGPVVREACLALAALASPPAAISCPADGPEPLLLVAPVAPDRPTETSCPRVAIITPNPADATPLDEIGVFLLRCQIPVGTPFVEVPLHEVDRLLDLPLDLVIVGCGGLLPLLDPPPALVRLVERTPRSVGLFGVNSLQDGPCASAGRLRALVTRLTAWFVRTAEDLLLHGRGLENVAWAGDWRLAGVPDTDPGALEEGRVELFPGAFASPEAFLARVQSFQRVTSSGGDVLLCALSSAVEVAWHSETPGARPPWDVRALMLDALGRPLPAGVLVPVDRQAVGAYRAQCGAAFDQVRQVLQALLTHTGDTLQTSTSPSSGDTLQISDHCVGCHRTSAMLERRAAAVAELVPRGACLLLCGEGEEALRRRLPPGCSLGTGEATPDGPPDIAVTLDLPLEEPAATRMMQSLIAPRCSVLACCSLSQPAGAGPWDDADDTKPLPAPGEALGRLVGTAGLYVQSGTRLGEDEILLQLDASPPHRPAPCRILLIAPPGTLHTGHARRLRLMRSLMPSHAHVDLLDPWSPRVPRQEYDLVILGAGNSFGPALLGPPERRTCGAAEHLLAILARARRSLGYFGTQFRGEIDEPHLQQVLDGLSLWLARTESDLEAHGRGRTQAVALGDLLLAVGEPCGEQRPDTLHAVHLTPLITALPHLRSFSWRDSRSPAGEPSGRFQAVLGDIFAGPSPEGQPIEVDPEALQRYMGQVRLALDELRSTIQVLLSS